MRPDDESDQKTTQLDLASLFPEKGDPRRPPEWFGRALIYAAIAVFVSIWIWRGWADIKPLVLIIVISLFIALAMDPIVVRLVKHGWRRGAASGVTLIGLCVAVVALMAVFGKMFVDQVIQMVNSLPSTYATISQWAKERFNADLPDMEHLGDAIMDWISTHNMADYAGQAWGYVVSLVGGLFAVFTVLLVTYYMSACSPKMLKSFCHYMSPRSQKRFLVTWTVLQDQISNFLYSRIILAFISSVCMSFFLMYLGSPYWLPLSMFCGLASQFVPTIGTYIGGALPVLSMWTTNSVKDAIIVIIYICIYQQFENLLLSPKISQRTMDINPAVAFLVVVLFGYLFGALGAFLALPVWAAIQVLFKMYTKQYELIDSPLLQEAKPVKKSAMVQGAENFNERVIKPVADKLPRAVRGSTNRVSTEDQYQQLIQDELGIDIPSPLTSSEQDDSETVAIPQTMLGQGSRGTGVSTGAGTGMAGSVVGVGSADSDYSADSADSDDTGVTNSTDVTEALRKRNEQGPAPEKSKFRTMRGVQRGNEADGAGAGGADDAEDADGVPTHSARESFRDDDDFEHIAEELQESQEPGNAAHRSSSDRPSPAKPRKSRHNRGDRR